MRRVHVQLSDEMATALEVAAASSDRSVAAVVRQAVGELLERDERRRVIERALGAIGGFRSGLTDVAENHDEYVVEAIEEHLGLR